MGRRCHFKRAQSRSEQHEAASLLGDAVIGTEDDSKADFVLEGLESLHELMENAMPPQFRHVLHADYIRLGILHELSEVTEQTPLLIGRSVETLCVPGERLARCTPNQDAPAIFWIKPAQLVRRDVADALPSEGNWRVIILVGEAASLIDVVTRDNTYSCIKKASRQPTSPAEQIYSHDASTLLLALGTPLVRPDRTCSCCFPYSALMSCHEAIIPIATPFTDKINPRPEANLFPFTTSAKGGPQ